MIGHHLPFSRQDAVVIILCDIAQSDIGRLMHGMTTSKLADGSGTRADLPHAVPPGTSNCPDRHENEHGAHGAVSWIRRHMSPRDSVPRHRGPNTPVGTGPAGTGLRMFCHFARVPSVQPDHRIPSIVSMKSLPRRQVVHVSGISSPRRGSSNATAGTKPAGTRLRMFCHFARVPSVQSDHCIPSIVSMKSVPRRQGCMLQESARHDVAARPLQQVRGQQVQDRECPVYSLVSRQYNQIIAFRAWCR
jgi:hypothetical protein